MTHNVGTDATHAVKMRRRMTVVPDVDLWTPIIEIVVVAAILIFALTR